MTAASISVLELSGNAHRRGETHGRKLAHKIRGHLEAWHAALISSGIADPHEYVDEMLRETDFRAAIAELAPELLDEVTGIAAGAGVSADRLFALQLMDEEWAYRASRGVASKRDKCSSVAINARDGTTLIGQNMDLGGYTDGYQVLLRASESGGSPAALIFSTAGLIALLGVNAAGVAVCVNSLPQLPSRRSGIPVAFVIRMLLRTRSLEEASTLVRTIPHATNQHYLIAEPGAARSFEASASGVNEYTPERSRVLHTNHPLTEHSGALDADDRYRENSVARLKSLIQRLAEGEPGLDEIKRALSSFDDPVHPVCRLRNDNSTNISFTTGSMISHLTRRADPIRCWVSAGPPTRGYNSVLLDRYGL